MDQKKVESILVRYDGISSYSLQILYKNGNSNNMRCCGWANTPQDVVREIKKLKINSEFNFDDNPTLGFKAVGYASFPQECCDYIREELSEEYSIV